MKKAIQHLSKDSVIADIIKNHQLEPLEASDNYFLLLIHSIISQQLSIKAAATIYKRFVDLFDNRQIEPKKVLQLSKENMRSIGISYQKAGYIHNVAEFALAGKLEKSLCDQMADDELIAHLSQIKGIGKWTAEMLLIFGMGRMDVFPYDDLGIMQIMVKHYEIQTNNKKETIQKMIEIAEKWRPYRSIACLYLWAKKDK
jgi:DNA-3-methyladenine glycosylase II